MSKFSRDQYLQSLAEVPLFSAFSKRDLQRVAKASEEVTIEAGAVIAEQGEQGRASYIVLDGSAAVRRNGRKVADLGPGSIIGELSLLDHGPRTATVTATTPMTVLAIDIRHFKAMLDDVPALTQKLLVQMASRVRELDRATYG